MDHTARTVATIVFIMAVAAAALYCAQRKTVARGDVLAAMLVQSSPRLERLECPREVPIGVQGATFECKAFFKNGEVADYTFALDREGRIATQSTPRIQKTSDPWE